MKVLPRINLAYWLTLMGASVFGTNTGDFCSDVLHMGHLQGLPYLGVAFLLVLLAEKGVKAGSALFFWAAIIIIRTAATNVGDAFHDYNIGFEVSLPICLALLVLAALLYWRMTPKATGNTVKVGWMYWLCMILAGIVGTVGGDYASFGLQLMPAGTAAVFGGIAVLLVLAGIKGLSTWPPYYWLSLAVIRTAGTGGGDALAHGLGLPQSTALTGAVFAAMLLVFYIVFNKSNQGETRAADGPMADPVN